MIEEIIQSSLSRQLIVVILAAMPVAELRASLPVAMTVFNLPWHQAFFLSIIGNFLPVPFLLLFLDGASRLISRNSKGKQFVEWVYRRTKRRTGLIKRYQHLGLVLLVAIPLPGTGAWTGSIAAHLMGVPFRYAILDISVGILGAGIIVSGLILLGWIGAGIALFGFALLVFFSLWRKRNHAVQL